MWPASDGSFERAAAIREANVPDELYSLDDEPPAYVCENGHEFDKAMRRLADLFCPECGTREVGRNGEPG